MHIRWIGCLVGMTLALSGCLPERDGLDISPEAVARREAEETSEVRLSLINRSPEALDVYVRQGGTEFRLGQARSIATSEFVIPESLRGSGTVSIVTETSPGRARLVSPLMSVRRGQTIVLEIASNYRLVSAWVQ